MAGRIPQHFIDQLLSRVDIVDLIDGYVPLKKAGANYKACCPFHNEKTPSFTVSPNKQFYHCFGCGENGTAISFLMNYDHMEFRDAIDKLAASAGMEIPEESVATPKNTQTSQGVDLYQLMQKVNTFYQTQLRNHPNRDTAISYLKNRGMSGQTAKQFGLGFAPEGWDGLLKELGGSAPMQKALMDTGMLTQNDSNRVYDRFRNRIMFPINDHRGRIVGFGGRVMDNGQPKYLNSPETPIFHKGSELYGLYEARKAINESDSVLVVEGYMDVVALAEAGIFNAVATLGTATTAMHLQRLFRHTKNIVFSFDGDRAGKDAAWKALQICLPQMQDGHQVSFLFLPDGEDPDSMVKKIGSDGFLKLVTEAKPLTEFLIDTLLQQADIKRLDGRAKLVNLAKPMLNAFPHGVLKKMVSERLAKLAQISSTDLLGSKPQTRSQQSSMRKHASKQKSIQMSNVRRAISLILQYPRFAEAFAELATVSPDQVRGIDLVHRLYDYCEQSKDISTAALLEKFREEQYFDTLKRLAHHAHNNLQEMSDEMALGEITGVVASILREAREIVSDDIRSAIARWESLNEKSKTGQLSDEELTQKESLNKKIRSFYQN